MKFYLSLLLLVVLVACNNNSNTPEPAKGAPSTEDEKMSYSIGYDLGTSFRNDSIIVINEYLVKGMLDAMADDTSEAKAALKREERQKISMDLSAKIQARHQQRQEQELKEFRSQGTKYKEEGEKYMAANKSKPGVVTLPSGIQYKVITEGKGKKPTGKSEVLMHLVAKFTDGKIFDQTIGKEPALLPVDKLIPGWQEIIPLMTVGSKWEVTIPYQLAYGENGYGTTIPPFATLIFEMELLEIKK